MPSNNRNATLILAAAGLLARPAPAAFTWPGCGEVQEAEFRYQALVGRSATPNPKVVDASLLEPIKMAFDLRPDGSTDIYWAERGGGLKRYVAARNQVVKVGALGVFTGSEQGLSGLALDPRFRENRRLYVFYAPSAEANVFRLSSFALNADLSALEPASEKVLIRIPSQRSSCCHTGGAMAFDAYGDLWVAVGKNSPDYPRSINEGSEASSTEATSADASDLRGGLIRIHPDESPKGYSIPAGNYGEYWAGRFRSSGETALAAEYSDPAKVRPEVYVKGARNPYSIAVDPVRRWVAWGEFGVNLDATMTEEHNLVSHPAFGGYPYFAGGGGTGGSGCTYVQGMCELWRGFDNSAGEKDRNAPINDSKWNHGPRRLPPVEPALHTYPRSGAVTGPIYRYDGASPSPIKFPPHFDKAWFVGDWRKNWIKIYKVDESGGRLTDSLTWFTRFGFNNVLDIQRGPDGALYVLNYEGSFGSTPRTHIGRVEYTGDCRPADPKFPSADPVSIAGMRSDFAPPAARVLPTGLEVEAVGGHEVVVTDPEGRRLARLRGTGPRVYSRKDLGASRPGLYLATVRGGHGERSITFVFP